MSFTTPISSLQALAGGILIFWALAAAPSVRAAADVNQAAPTAEAAKPLAAGVMMPDVTVRDAAGKPVRLRAAVAGKGAVLVFYRGGWCPYCNRHLGALAKIEKDLMAKGLQIFAVSPDRPEKLAGTAEKNGAGYQLLSDSSAEAMLAFGLAFKVQDSLVERYKSQYGIDLEADSGATHHLLPVPAVFLVNGEGEIVFAQANADYKNRISAENLLTAADSVF